MWGSAVQCGHTTGCSTGQALTVPSSTLTKQLTNSKEDEGEQDSEDADLQRNDNEAGTSVD